MPNYTLNKTNGVDPKTITIGTASGPSTQNPIVDLDLYGQGALNWGRGVDQNLLKLLENFACPQRVRGPGDVRPVNREDPITHPDYGTAVYAPSTTTGSGINAPILGMLWFNTTDGKMYRCIDDDPLEGDRFEASKNAIWDVVAADPDLFLPLVGGTLTGPVDMVSDNARLTLSSSNATNDVLLEFNDTQSTKGLIALENDTIDAMVWRKLSGGGTNPIITELRMQDDGFEIVKGSSGVGTFEAGTLRTEPTTDAMQSNVVATKGYNDAKYVNTAGDTMTGNLFMSKVAPRVRITTSDTLDDDSAIEFRNSVEQKAKITHLAQGGVDSFSLEKWKNGNYSTRFLFRDDFIEVDLGPTGSRAAGGGTVRGEATLSTDPSNTLTTKGYVDTEISTNAVQQGGDDMPTGTYRFGVPFDDTTIVGPIITSTIADTQDTRINGPEIRIRDDINGPGVDPFSTMTLTSTSMTFDASQSTSVGPGLNFIVGEFGAFGPYGLDFFIGGSAANQRIGRIGSAGSNSTMAIEKQQGGVVRSRSFYQDTRIISEIRSSTLTIEAQTTLQDGDFTVSSDEPQLKLTTFNTNTNVRPGVMFFESTLRRGGMALDTNDNEVTVFSETNAAADGDAIPSPAGALNDSSISVVRLDNNLGISSNRRFDFVSNVWIGDRTTAQYTPLTSAASISQSLRQGSTTGRPRNGDIIIDGVEAFIAIGGSWVKITP